jgi:ribosomal protein S18 acetylase RimI-like enzyme
MTLPTATELIEAKLGFPRIESYHDPDEMEVSVSGTGEDSYLGANYSSAKDMVKRLRGFGSNHLADHIASTHKSTERIGYINGFEVEEDQRGRGLGSEMLGRALHHLGNEAKVSHTYLHLHVGKNDPEKAALRVYSKHGFNELGVLGKLDVYPVFHKKHN